MAKHDAVIAKILVELDKEEAIYQYRYFKLHGTRDKQAEQTYDLLKNLCERIRKELNN